MGKREELVKAYVQALEIRPLVILSVVGGRPTRISSEPVNNLDIVDALYFAKPQHAELVLAHVLGDLDAIGALRPQGWIDMPAREVRDTLANVARYLGAPFRSMAQVTSDAEKAVERIIENVERARIKGELRQVNAKYKTYRQGALAAGEKPISYSDHLGKFTRSLVLLAAQNANAAGLRTPESVGK